MTREPCYGAFPGGDPRGFQPDPEMSTAAEREAWARDCAAWDRGEREYSVDVRTFDEGLPELCSDGTVTPARPFAFVTSSGYGLGTYWVDASELEPPGSDDEAAVLDREAAEAEAP